MARDFDSGELPHAREKHVVVRAGIADKDRATARVAQNRGGDAYFHGGTLQARRGNFARQVARAGHASARNRTRSATGNLRRANRLAEFHQRLVPITGCLEREQILREFAELAPASGSTKVATNCAQAREDTGNVA